MIRITAKRKQGFRRCGVFHPAEPVKHADARFTQAELAVLQAEPLLRVEVIAEQADVLPDDQADAMPDDQADAMPPVKISRRRRR